jgi:2-oxoglutarate dehydrogenase E1 component
VFTPKSLLRHPGCTSSVADFTSGGFREVIDDKDAMPDNVSRVIFCSGKIYYDLLEGKEKFKRPDVALVRLEQIYPLPLKQLDALLRRYAKAGHWEWVQEEPSNMGALKYLQHNFTSVHLHYTARPPSGSPATGSGRLHKIQQQLIVEKAFGQCSCESAFGSCRLHCADTEETKK